MGREGGEHGCVRFVTEQPVPEGPDRQIGHGGKGRAVVGVEDETGDFVRLVGHHGFSEKLRERHVGEGVLGGYSFDGVGGGEAGQFISRAGRGCFCEQGAKIGKRVGGTAKRGAKNGHRLRAAYSSRRARRVTFR